MFFNKKMSKKEKKSCWEFFRCPNKHRVGCPAHEYDMGKECWYVLDVDKGCPGAKIYSTCFECPWFKIASKEN